VSVLRHSAFVVHLDIWTVEKKYRHVNSAITLLHT